MNVTKKEATIVFARWIEDAHNYPEDFDQFSGDPEKFYTEGEVCAEHFFCKTSQKGCS